MKSSKFIVIIVLLTINLLLPKFSLAQYTKLHDFDGPISGEAPYGNVLIVNGYMYGMTYSGGMLGVLFKCKLDGSDYSILVNFNQSIGNHPEGSLIYDGTFLYGFTKGALGTGNMFKVKPDGTEFAEMIDFNPTIGYHPSGTPVSDGNFLYGITENGGSANKGTIFKIKHDGTNHEIISEFDSIDYVSPQPHGSLVMDSTYLYGVTKNGGFSSNNSNLSINGTIYKIKKDGAGFSTIHSFNSGVYSSTLYYDGTFLYGMTNEGSGTIFKMKPDGSDFTTIHNFNDLNVSTHYSDEALFFNGGFLYGMTSNGGMKDGGTIFKIKPDGTNFSKLIDFDCDSGGCYPYGSFVSDGTSLYGMTITSNDTYLKGTVFKIKPDGTEYTTIIRFGTGYSYHRESLTQVGEYLYGINSNRVDSIAKDNAIFKVKKDGSAYEEIYNYSNNTLNAPVGQLTFDGTYIYGLTSTGGSGSCKNGCGGLFKIKPDGSAFTIIYEFPNKSCSRYTPLHLDNGILYGINGDRLAYNPTQGESENLFKINTDGTGYTEIYSFNAQNEQGTSAQNIQIITYENFLFGINPNISSVVNLNKRGRIYKVKPDGTQLTVFENFDTINGFEPCKSLIPVDSFLFGVTRKGGANNFGTIYKIKTDLSGYTKVYDVETPCYGIFYDGQWLYGTLHFQSNADNTQNNGIIFKILPDGTGYTELMRFDGYKKGDWPVGNLFSDGAYLYGLTRNGGVKNWGTIYKFNPYCTPVNYNQSITICEGDSLSVGSKVYTSSGIYEHIFSNIVNGCDSTVTTNLTVLSANTVSQTITKCAGQSIIVGTNTYTISGTYLDVFTAFNGCDSSVTTNLTVVSPTAYYTTIYDTLQNTFTLKVDSATTAVATSYYWDFGDGNTSTLATPTHVYTVDTVYNVCLKITTASNDTCPYCHVIGKDYIGNIYRTSGFTINVINSNLTSVSSSSSNENSFVVFPNPTSGETEIMFNQSVNNITIKVFNVTVQKIVEKTNVSGNRFKIDISNQAQGIYFIEIISADNVWRGKLIKQ